MINSQKVEIKTQDKPLETATVVWLMKYIQAAFSTKTDFPGGGTRRGGQEF